MKLIKSFFWAMNGLRTTWREEFNFRIELLVGLLVVCVGFYLGLSTIEWAILVGCITVVLSAELVNTAIEDLCDKVEPQTDPVIGKIKDIMAGFVLVSCVGAALIGLIVLGSHLI